MLARCLLLCCWKSKLLIVLLFSNLSIIDSQLTCKHISTYTFWAIVFSLSSRLLHLDCACYADKRNLNKHASTIGLERFMSNNVIEQNIKMLHALGHAYHLFTDSSPIHIFELNYYWQIISSGKIFKKFFTQIFFLPFSNPKAIGTKKHFKMKLLGNNNAFLYVRSLLV